jgi:hypothetical protein
MFFNSSHASSTASIIISTIVKGWLGPLDDMFALLVIQIKKARGG